MTKSVDLGLLDYRPDCTPFFERVQLSVIISVNWVENSCLSRSSMTINNASVNSVI